MKEIYLDNAAATPIETRVLSAMAKASGFYGNPSSFNDSGRSARKEIEKSRGIIAKFLDARPDEIVFTSSGSEANNIAIMTTLSGLKSGNVVTTPIEHQSVSNALKRSGLNIKYVSVDRYGFVDLKSFEQQLGRQCKMVSVMYANNEIGTIEPIKKISQTISRFNQKNGTNILFHVDACQAALFLDMSVQRLKVDFLTFDGCKLYGPHGIGVLYVKRGTHTQALAGWVGQEKGLKAGTENTQSIIGLAKAVALISTKDSTKIGTVRDYAFEQLKNIPELIFNGPAGSGRLPNNINICLPKLTSEVLLLELDKYGIRAGSGSACTSHSVEPSDVLKAIGVPPKYINGALRFSLGRDTTKKDIDYLVRVLSKIIPELKKRYARFK
ncbi:MAG: cysteine desulfurase family protein [Patescibacteria group bacterium]